ncbi:MAG TPA: AAA family ATPase [Thermoplasmata archaeon]|nr:AAA family ATPase [Thermoplasmata archaeon]
MVAADVGGRPFVGRVETVEALHRRFEDARAGTGGVTFLVGETGVGKSTLVRSLVEEMRARGARVLEGRAPPVDAPPPFSLLRSALEGARGGDDLADGEVALAAEPVLLGFAPRLDDGAFHGPVPIEERLLSALGEADERVAGFRDPLWAAVAEQFGRFVRRGPTVLVLEDLQRADDRSLEAVEFLARQFPARPFWILATVRPYAALPPMRRSRLESVEKATEARRVVLPPLTSEEVAAFLRERDPERRFTEEEVARRYSESGGNPLLLEQIDRRVRAGSERAPPPANGDGELGEAEERALSVAAVIGPEIPFALLLASSGEDEERLAESVDALVARGLLLERPGEVVSFADERAREERYQHLTASRRRLLHRRVGEALEATGATDLGTVYALARHFSIGKVDEKSLRYNRLAADIAERSFSPETAREHLERGLESFRRLRPDDAAGETELVLALAQQVGHLGELKEAEGILQRHLKKKGLADRLPPHVRVLLELYLARIQTDRGEWKGAEETTTRLLAATDLTAHPVVAIGLHRLRGEALYYLARYPEALAEHSQELQLARSSGNERAAALGRSHRANVLAMMGRADDALEEGRAAARTLEALGDLREAAYAHMFIGVVIASLRLARPRYDEAIEEFHEAIRLAERAHDQRRIGWALFNEADILHDAGRLPEAAERNARSRELLERIGDRFGLVQSMIVAGKIALATGEYDRAEADLLEAYRLARELKAPADEVDVVLRLAQLSYARGDRASARRRVKELERQNLPALRPDVAADFERLKRALASGAAGAGDAAR